MTKGKSILNLADVKKRLTDWRPKSVPEQTKRMTDTCTSKLAVQKAARKRGQKGTSPKRSMTGPWPGKKLVGSKKKSVCNGRKKSLRRRKHKTVRRRSQVHQQLTSPKNDPAQRADNLPL
jgi:hypothetical protein